MTRSARSADGGRRSPAAGVRGAMGVLCLLTVLGVCASPALARERLLPGVGARVAGHADRGQSDTRARSQNDGCSHSAARAAEAGGCEGSDGDPSERPPAVDLDDGGPPPPPPPSPNPALSLSMLEQDLTTSSGLSHTSTLAVSLGDSLSYLMKVTNSGNVDLVGVGISASLCAPSSGPYTDASAAVALPGVLAPGASAFFTCSRSVRVGDPSPLIDAAQAMARTTDLRHSVASNTDSVGALVAPGQASMTVSSYEQDLSLPGSALGQGPITVRVGDVISYQVSVQNGGTEPLLLSLRDSACPTAVGPSSAPNGPLLGGALLAPHASASFTCTHTVLAADGPWLVNTATVTGTRAGAAPLTVTTAVLAGVLGSSSPLPPGPPGARGQMPACVAGPARLFSRSERSATRLLVSGRNIATVTFRIPGRTLATLHAPNGSGGRFVIDLSVPYARLRVTAVIRGRCGAPQLRSLRLAPRRRAAPRPAVRRR